jgi:hypothetical protein
MRAICNPPRTENGEPAKTSAVRSTEGYRIKNFIGGPLTASHTKQRCLEQTASRVMNEFICCVSLLVTTGTIHQPLDYMHMPTAPQTQVVILRGLRSSVVEGYSPGSPPQNHPCHHWHRVLKGIRHSGHFPNKNVSCNEDFACQFISRPLFGALLIN